MSLFNFKRNEDDSGSNSTSFGPYRLHELINSGGMADLWLASNQKEETYALRIMHRRLRFNFQAKKRFIRGCEILSKIHNHQYVVGYFDHGKIEGRPYLLMEYVEGANMRELFNRNDPVLIVDDEISVCDTLKKLLERSHFQVTSFSMPTEALRCIESQPFAFDLILTDLTMPNMTGIHLAMKIHRINPDVPIPFFSAILFLLDRDQ